MSKPIDQPLYFVECDFGKLGKAFLELDRDKNSRAAVISAIASGEYRDVITVLECNPVEGTCRNVTEDINDEAEHLRDQDARFAPIDRIANTQDHVRDYRKHGETV